MIDLHLELGLDISADFAISTFDIFNSPFLLNSKAHTKKNWAFSSLQMIGFIFRSSNILSWLFNLELENETHTNFFKISQIQSLKIVTSRRWIRPHPSCLRDDIL